MRRAVEELADDDLRLQTSERCTDTEVRALAKGDVALAARAIQPKVVGVIEMGRIPVGRTPQQHKAGACAEIDATQLVSLST